MKRDNAANNESNEENITIHESNAEYTHERGNLKTNPTAIWVNEERDR